MIHDDQARCPMSELLKLTHKLHDTAAMIEHLERALAQTPESLTVRLSIESVVRHFDELQRELQGELQRYSRGHAL